ncbi:MAG: ATP-binding protein [Pirellulales bacterium]
MAHTRIHGTTKKHVGQLFESVERAALGRLPDERFPFYDEGKRRVSRDGHIEVQHSFYSAPPMTTSSRPLENWGKLRGDVPSAPAVLDRFLHHLEVIQITGKGYRLVPFQAPNDSPPATVPKSGRRLAGTFPSRHRTHTFARIIRSLSVYVSQHRVSMVTGMRAALDFPPRCTRTSQTSTTMRFNTSHIVVRRLCDLIVLGLAGAIASFAFQPPTTLHPYRIAVAIALYRPDAPVNTKREKRPCVPRRMSCGGAFAGNLVQVHPAARK